MKKTTRYAIAIRGQKGITICASGWSQFYKRLSAKDNGKLRGQVYGKAQAIQHADELRKFIYDGKRIHRHDTFEIIRITTIEKIVAVRKGKAS